MKTQLIAAGLVLTTAAAVVLSPQPGRDASAATTIQTTSRASRVEVVFVLDTTSSMSGLIETAKEKIWSIATTMAQAAENPAVEIGLVAFRDRGDDYVTQVVDLSPDLDTMYATLMQFAAVGGGDGPESVNAGLADAVERISWSTDQDTYRVVFLVGDAPPHMDYQGEAHYPEIVRAAAARGIVVNAIQCGSVHGTAAHWHEIARLGNGRYMQVGQTGDAFAVATPYDDDIARLSAELDGTRLFYGDDEARAAFERRESATDSLHAAASPAAQARRAIFNTTAAGSLNLFGDSDLVAEVEAGRVRLEDLPPEALPETLRTLPPAARNAEIESIAKRRAALREQIDELGRTRAGFIEAEVDAAGGATDSFDRQIYDAVREQAAGKGLTYEAGPAF
jgi:Mg-chelatase subunit ChlD